MKFSVSSYSFAALMRTGEMTQLDCVKKAKEMGFDGIEFVDITPHDGSSREEYADQLRQACEKEQLTISNYTISADFLNGSGGDTAAEVKRVCAEIDMAVRLGATSVRHDACQWANPAKEEFQSFDRVLPKLSDACREVTVYAASKGVRTMVENHGYFCQDSERVEKLVNAVNHPNFGLLCDMGNFLCVDEPPELAFGRVAPYAFYVHAKDFIWKDGNGINPGKGFLRTRGGNYIRGTIIGHGVVPVKQCLDIMKANGYDGMVAIEFEGPETPVAAIEAGLENLKNYSA